MYTLILIFYISTFCVVAMIMLKRREIATGRRNIVSRVGAGSDHIFHAFFAIVKRGYGYLNSRTFILAIHWAAFHVLKLVRHIYVEIKSQTLANPHGKKLIDAVRGRGEVKPNGASFYLRRISSDHSLK